MKAPPNTHAMDHASGDARALYQAQVGYVWNTLRRLGVAEADREDLCHEVFLVFFRGTAFDPTRPLRPWLFGIAFRIASDHRRRARFRYEVPGPDREPASSLPLQDAALEQKQARQLVERALEGLDLDQRAVFILHEIDGLPMPEIAGVLDAPLNTLYSRLRLARKKFAAAVQALSDRGPGGPAPRGGTPPRGALTAGGGQ